MRLNFVTVGICLSVLLSSLALALSIASFANEQQEQEPKRYRQRQPTDEQRAEQVYSDSPVFQGLSDGKIAIRALASLCGQIDCARLDEYTNSFGRDGQGAAGAFWYSPRSSATKDPMRANEHFLCRFRNEDWVFCLVSFEVNRPSKMIYARTVPEIEIRKLELDTKVEFRQRSSNEMKRSPNQTTK